MNERTQSGAKVKGEAGNRELTRFERWLGVTEINREAARQVAPQPTRSVTVTQDSPQTNARLESWLGVQSTNGDTVRPSAPSPLVPPVSFGHHAAAAGTGLASYAAPAIAVLTAAVLGLGLLTLDLRGQVTSLKKTVAAESSTTAVTDRLKQAESDLAQISASLKDIEGLRQNVGTVETRLAELEKRFPRKK